MVTGDGQKIEMKRIKGHIKARKSVRESIEFCVEKIIYHFLLFQLKIGADQKSKLV